ncbi:MAG: ABC transporter substrate-binding protein [Microbacterium sp.]|uniref:ABC transporter substrate-binding protein n=1 Tax=Microbacterium sp. TaxID=51671 RepID=UPI0039E70D45
MFTQRRTRIALATAAALGTALAVSGCASSDPLAAETADAGTIVVGSQSYYSNEIIAEIYAQALENAGFTVDRQFDIGQRDAYMPELESGAITLFPEYTGNLAQWLDSSITDGTADEVYDALVSALPDNLTALDYSSATDQDSYTVTRAFADEWDLTSIADLANVTDPLTLGGPAELADRPYGPTGLKSTYGIDIGFSATGDTTVEDLLAGTINVANIYTADPAIQTDDLVTLTDPKGLLLPSNVVPIVNSDVAPDIEDVINAISAKLTPEGLIALNVQSTVDQENTADIAAQWLSDNGLS